jgi:hypothetical protein
MVEALIMARGYKAGRFHRQAKTAVAGRQNAASRVQVKLVAMEFRAPEGVPEKDRSCPK